MWIWSLVLSVGNSPTTQLPIVGNGKLCFQEYVKLLVCLLLYVQLPTSSNFYGGDLHFLILMRMAVHMDMDRQQFHQGSLTYCLSVQSHTSWWAWCPLWLSAFQWCEVSFFRFEIEPCNSISSLIWVNCQSGVCSYQRTWFQRSLLLMIEGFV